jgi:acetoin utilization protein AcuB
MKVKRVMTRNPISIETGKSVDEARQLMQREHISCLPVLDRSGTLTGLITKSDLSRGGPTEATTLDRYEINYLLAKIKVDKIMEKHVITVDEEEVVEEAARIMADRHISCLPVMRESLLVGIVTQTDLFKVLIDLFGARKPGVRLSVQVGDKKGQLAKLTENISSRGGNIISLLTASGDDPAHRREVIRISGLGLEDVKQVVAEVGDAEIEDIRE